MKGAPSPEEFRTRVSKKSIVTVLSSIHFIQLITAILVLVAVKCGVEYGQGVCLLNVKDYNLHNDTWTFLAESNACKGILGLAGAALAFTLVIGIMDLGYVARDKLRSKPMIYTMMAASFLQVALSVCVAVLFTAGMVQTCNQFTQSGKTCENVFYTGFFYKNDVNMRYRRNIGVAWMGVICSWIMVVSWVVYSLKEILSVKYETNRWW